MSREPIHGRVARILNSRELVINKGSSDGVHAGMVFDVLDPKGEDIQDPITRESLGSVYRPKIQVKVSEVKERLAVARTFKSHEINVGGLGGMSTTRIFQPPKWVKRYETFKTEDAAWEEIRESASFVKVGDPIVEVTTDEPDGAARALPDIALTAPEEPDLAD